MFLWGRPAVQLITWSRSFVFSSIREIICGGRLEIIKLYSPRNCQNDIEKYIYTEENKECERKKRWVDVFFVSDKPDEKVCVG